ncbi:MlaD family protein [Acinetobacter haemolyticus]|nr:hypothetical protein [Acinetobacter haemolyticus]NAR52101.1 hypothetical protein [Acinetobacter haemolyticus]
MTDNREIIDLLTAIVSTIENQDTQTQIAKSELLEQLKMIASKTDTVSTNFPKLIETLSNFDSKIASSFDDIQNISKQLNSVVQQINIAEKAIQTVQQQAQNLQLDETIKTLYKADQSAQQLNRYLNTSSQTYSENMTAATDIAINQIKRLKQQVNTIANSFAEIVATDISDKIVHDVSVKLTQHVIQKLKIDIETGAKESAEMLASKAFQHLTLTLANTKNSVETSSREFHREVINTYENDLKQLKTLSAEIQKTATRSNMIYMQREEAYQNHVSQEKAQVKKNWVLIAAAVWIGFTATVAGTAYATSKSAESVVNKATGYVDLQNNWMKNGFRGISKEECNAYMPKQQFMQNRPIDFCYFSKTPAHQIQTQQGYLNIFTK